MKKSQNPPKKQKLSKEEKPKKSNIPEIKPPVTKGISPFQISILKLNMVFSIGPTAQTS